MGKYFLLLLIGLFFAAGYRVYQSWGAPVRLPAASHGQPASSPPPAVQDKPKAQPKTEKPDPFFIIGVSDSWVQIEGFGILRKGDVFRDHVLLAWSRTKLLVRDSQGGTSELFAENPSVKLAAWAKENRESGEVKTASVISSVLPSISSQEIDSSK